MQVATIATRTLLGNALGLLLMGLEATCGNPALAFNLSVNKFWFMDLRMTSDKTKAYHNHHRLKLV